VAVLTSCDTVTLNAHPVSQSMAPTFVERQKSRKIPLLVSASIAAETQAHPRIQFHLRTITHTVRDLQCPGITDTDLNIVTWIRSVLPETSREPYGTHKAKVLF